MSERRPLLIGSLACVAAALCSPAARGTDAAAARGPGGPPAGADTRPATVPATRPVAAEDASVTPWLRMELPDNLSARCREMLGDDPVQRAGMFAVWGRTSNGSDFVLVRVPVSRFKDDREDWRVQVRITDPPDYANWPKGRKAEQRVAGTVEMQTPRGFAAVDFEVRMTLPADARPVAAGVATRRGLGGDPVYPATGLVYWRNLRPIDGLSVTR